MQIGSILVMNDHMSSEMIESTQRFRNQREIGCKTLQNLKLVDPLTNNFGKDHSCQNPKVAISHVQLCVRSHEAKTSIGDYPLRNAIHVELSHFLILHILKDKASNLSKAFNAPTVHHGVFRQPKLHHRYPPSCKRSRQGF